jgi:hypothetical protein
MECFKLSMQERKKCHNSHDINYVMSFLNDNMFSMAVIQLRLGNTNKADLLFSHTLNLSN